MSEVDADRGVRVDEWLCAGHARCEEVAPELFRVNDDGLAEVLQQPDSEELWGKAEEAALACPVQAILVERNRAQAAS